MPRTNWLLQSASDHCRGHQEGCSKQCRYGFKFVLRSRTAFLSAISPAVILSKLPDAGVEQHAGVLHCTPQCAAAATAARLLLLICRAKLWQELAGYRLECICRPHVEPVYRCAADERGEPVGAVCSKSRIATAQTQASKDVGARQALLAPGFRDGMLNAEHATPLSNVSRRATHFLSLSLKAPPTGLMVSTMCRLLRTLSRKKSQRPAGVRGLPARFARAVTASRMPTSSSFANRLGTSPAQYQQHACS